MAKKYIQENNFQKEDIKIIEKPIREKPEQEVKKDIPRHDFFRG